MGMTDNPLTNAWMPQKVRRVPGINAVFPKANTKASSPAQPAVFRTPNQRSSLNIASTAVDNIAFPDQVPLQATGVFRTDASDPIYVDPIVADV